ncbi:Aspartate aminotransferase [compost metagenome]
MRALCGKVKGLRARRDDSGNLISTDTELALYLLREAGVAVVPGTAFELPGHFRVSYAAADEQLRMAMGPLAEACARLQ